MNIETKEVMLPSNENGARDKRLKVYETFGWKYTQDVHRGRSFYNLLARDMDMPNYPLIKALEDKYFSLESQKKTYVPVNDEPINFLIMFLLFLLFVFPLVIYLFYKSNQKERFAAINAELEKQMNDILKEAATLL